jgi:glyoxylase-like metal-dependent hydrolase (beta-lactamase superfamily II)
MDARSLEMPIDPPAPAVTGGVARIAPQVWRIVAPNPSPLTGPGTNTYVVGSRRPVVIDPGMQDAAHLARIMDVTGGTVDAVVCTHSHPDHSPGAAELRARTGARVVGLPAPRDPYQDTTYVPDATLADDEPLRHPEFRLRALRTPGHVSNHLCLLLEDERLLFTGDHLMQGTTVVIIPPEGSMRDYLASLRRLQGLPIDALAPGHGTVIENAQDEIARVIAHRLKRESKVVAALAARGRATLDELLPTVYDDVPVSLHAWARHSLLAHAIKLVEEGRASESGETYEWRG